MGAGLMAKGPYHPSLGQRPRNEVEKPERAESPPHPSIPSIAFIVSHRVFCEERPIFVLKRARPVMLLLTVDVCQQRIQIAWTDGEHAIATLPCEARQFRRLGFEPFRRRRFQFLDQSGDGHGARKLNGEVNVIRHATDTRAFAPRIARDGREISVERRADGRAQARETMLKTR